MGSSPFTAQNWDTRLSVHQALETLEKSLWVTWSCPNRKGGRP